MSFFLCGIAFLVIGYFTYGKLIFRTYPLIIFVPSYRIAILKKKILISLSGK